MQAKAMAWAAPGPHTHCDFAIDGKDIQVYGELALSAVRPVETLCEPRENRNSVKEAYRISTPRR